MNRKNHLVGRGFRIVLPFSEKVNIPVHRIRSFTSSTKLINKPLILWGKAWFALKCPSFFNASVLEMVVQNHPHLEHSEFPLPHQPTFENLPYNDFQLLFKSIDQIKTCFRLSSKLLTSTGTNSSDSIYSGNTRRNYNSFKNTSEIFIKTAYDLLQENEKHFSILFHDSFYSKHFLSISRAGINALKSSYAENRCIKPCFGIASNELLRSAETFYNSILSRNPKSNYNSFNNDSEITIKPGYELLKSADKNFDIIFHEGFNPKHVLILSKSTFCALKNYYAENRSYSPEMYSENRKERFWHQERYCFNMSYKEFYVGNSEAFKLLLSNKSFGSNRIITGDMFSFFSLGVKRENHFSLDYERECSVQTDRITLKSSPKIPDFLQYRDFYTFQLFFFNWNMVLFHSFSEMENANQLSGCQYGYTKPRMSAASHSADKFALQSGKFILQEFPLRERHTSRNIKMTINKAKMPTNIFIPNQSQGKSTFNLEYKLRLQKAG
ncbi:MAG: hypothetical protein HQM10_00570 [Candidatus Riflebacteria bacterium]|nr:hypothetical protein [Candidatus Riflebacteria bacterium]